MLNISFKSFTVTMNAFYCTEITSFVIFKLHVVDVASAMVAGEPITCEFRRIKNLHVKIYKIKISIYFQYIIHLVILSVLRYFLLKQDTYP